MTGDSVQYNRAVRSVELADGTIIADVLGTDPTPDGPRWVGYTDAGDRRTWYADEIVRVIDAQFDLLTTWAEERIEQQR